jgi:hypothetical protein
MCETGRPRVGFLFPRKELDEAFWCDADYPTDRSLIALVKHKSGFSLDNVLSVALYWSGLRVAEGIRPNDHLADRKRQMQSLRLQELMQPEGEEICATSNG